MIVVLSPISAPLAQIWVPKILCHIIYAQQMLEIVANYHCMLFQGKLMNQTWENGKKPSFRPDFETFWRNFGPQKFFSWFLNLLDVRNCFKLSLYAISRKINEPTWEIGRKPSFRLNFSPNLDPKIFFVKFIWNTCYTLLPAISMYNFNEN